MGLVSSGLAQTQPKVDTGKPIPLGTPAISEYVARNICERVFSELHLPKFDFMASEYRPKVGRHSIVGSKWWFKLSNGYETEISAQTGLVLMINLKSEMDKLSRLDMFRRANRSQQKLFGVPPKCLLVSPQSRLLDYSGRKVIRLLQQGGYIETLPNATPSGDLSTLSVSFSNDGRLVGFLRNVDCQLGKIVQRVSKSEAQRIAKTAVLPESWGRVPDPDYVPEKRIKLGYVLEASSKPANLFTNDSEKAHLAWVVRTFDREVWVDVASGKVVGGWFYRSVRAN